MGISRTGRVVWFHDEMGYGFIERPPELPSAPLDERGKPTGQVFVHYSMIKMPGHRTLENGALVTYELVEGPNGLLASNVSRLER